MLTPDDTNEYVIYNSAEEMFFKYIPGESMGWTTSEERIGAMTMKEFFDNRLTAMVFIDMLKQVTGNQLDKLALVPRHPELGLDFSELVTFGELLAVCDIFDEKDAWGSYGIGSWGNDQL